MICVSRPEDLSSWNIHAGHYPRDGSQLARNRFLLGYAILAPSSHNTQPWLFRVDEDGIDVYVDGSRKLHVIDHSGRQLYMSVGAAVFNLRLAMLRFGHAPVVETFPLAGDPTCVARVSPGALVEPRLRDFDLFDAIATRHTNRQPFLPVPVSYRIADELIEAADDEGAWLLRLHPDARTKAAELIAAADRAQFRDKRFRRELSQWLVANDSPRGDGIPGYSKSYGAPISRATNLLVRTFDLGDRVADDERDLVNGSPMLAVLGTDGDGPADWLAAGHAMQHALLAAGIHGLSASFLNQALELNDFRDRFSDITDRGYPQLVLRFGYAAAAAKATPRRSVADVIIDPLTAQCATG